METAATTMRHLRALLLLLALDLLFFQSLVRHPGHILYSDHSDLIAEHIPAKRFLVRSFQQTGELPLWCPYLFAGSPFVHDIQVAMFYPPHLLLLLLPEEAVGPALSWLVVLHVLLAGWLMYAYAVHRGVTGAPAVVAAMGFMFGGRWLMHLLGGGHYILIGLAWLPLVLLGWEKAVQQRRLFWGLVAGIGFALMTLSTQPQWTFYSGIFAALWTFAVVLESPERRSTLLRWMGYGALIVAMTVGLTAIQLLPTMEAAGQSSRAGGVGFEGILEGGVRVLLFLVGPALTEEPFNLAWEDRGGLAMIWLIVAVWAPVLRTGRTRYEAGVCLGLFLFAAGGAVLFQPLPGFSLFRQPARMAVVAMLPVAFLAAVAVQAVTAPEGLTEEQRAACKHWLIRVTVAIAILGGGFLLRLRFVEGKQEALGGRIYFLIAGGLIILAWLLLHRQPRINPTRQGILWAGLLGLDVFSLGIGFVRSSDRSVTEYVPRIVHTVAAQQHENRGRVLDPGQDILGAGDPVALLVGLDSVSGYSPLDVRRYREYLQMIADRDDPLRALDSTFSYPVIGRFDVVNQPLLDLLNVRFVLSQWAPDMWGPFRQWKNDSDIEYVYNFLRGGLVPLLGCYAWENPQCLPRAFVVPQAKPLPERSAVLETFKKTDFRRLVFLEKFDEEPPSAGPASHDVRIRDYEPNRVRISVEGNTPGFLFLGDVWFPGWTCTVNGEAAKVYRANYTFRAVKVPAGAVEVVFRFEPRSYLIGRRITLGTLALTVGMLLLSGRRKNPSGCAPERSVRSVA